LEIEYIPGLELSRRFYLEVVGPVLQAQFPDLKYSAALLGIGSEVLGYDTVRSTDHDWGPRVMLFLSQADHARQAGEIEARLRASLPETFLGYPVIPPNRTRDHMGFQILTLRGYILSYLGFDLDHDLEPADWVTFPEQKLLSLTCGAVFRDEVGLEVVRQRFAYYPHDVWLYLLASGWNRIGQEEHLMGRAGQVGDEVGSALIAARLVRDLMRLWFLMEHQYAPYPKWFGTAFARLPGAGDLIPIFQKVLTAGTWTERQEHLAQAYEQTAARHNRLGLTEPLPEKRSWFFDRPFLVIGGKTFSDDIYALITDPAVKKWNPDRLIGSIDQFSDSTDLIADERWRIILRKLYE
jgi:hypothetical protein